MTMRITALFLSALILLTGGGTHARLNNASPNNTHRKLQSINTLAATNPVPSFVDLMLEWARTSERGPTISGHFMAMVNIALFDSWAAFEPTTTGVITDLAAIQSSVPVFSQPEEERRQMQVYAMTSAAYDVITTMGATLLQQKYLEGVNGEDATELLAGLNAQALELRTVVFDALRVSSYGVNDIAVPVATAVKNAILNHIENDNSNFLIDYADTTSGYTVKPWVEPTPCRFNCEFAVIDPDTSLEKNIGDGIKDYDFYSYSLNVFDDQEIERVPASTTSSYTYNTFDAALAKEYYEGSAVAPNMTIHPLVLTGELQLTTSWQSLSQIGFFPKAADGGEQFPLTPHWGSVSPLSIPNGSVFRSEYIGPYDSNGNVRQEWIDENAQLVDLGFKQQRGQCPRCRAESEYWELGDEFVYPPGWWIQRANDFVRSQDLNTKMSLQLILGTSLTVFDSGVAAWEMKYFYDSARPFTSVNELYHGSMVSDWTGTGPYNKQAKLDERNFWRPYQLRRNASPPFPENPSGHSAFSTSASVVLRSLLGTNTFNFVSEPFNSRFDDFGFDGDNSNGNEDWTLNFDMLSQAADAAGFSRLLGGIHPMAGNIAGLEIGTKIGHSTLSFLRGVFGEEDLGADPVTDVTSNLVFGTGGDDDLLVAPCSTSPVEVYGFYGSDVLVADCASGGSVSLFGGNGADTFQIGNRATIQDYEVGVDKIILLQDSGTLTVSSQGSLATVSVDGVAAVDLDGSYVLSDLTIKFQAARKRVREPKATWYPDYQSGKCLQDCETGPFGCAQAPPYIVLYGSLETCCDLGLSWVDTAYCYSRSSNQYTNGWVVDYTNNKCTMDCDPSDGPPCAEIVHSVPHTTVYTTSEKCCQTRLGWLNLEACDAASQNIEYFSDKFYPYYEGSKCAKDCDPAGGLPCMGNPPASAGMSAFESAQTCCQERLGWIGLDKCIADTNGVALTNQGTREWYVDWGRDGTCVKDCVTGTGCGGLKETWETGFPSSSACCDSIPWKVNNCHI